MEQGQTYSHRPVLLDECIEGLRIRPGGLYLDGTLGRAGHSREIAKRLTAGRLICVDRDQAALEAAGIAREILDGVHSPIGLPIGAQTPAEIAVSIAGEMICVRATRREDAGIKLHGCPMH